MMCLNLVCEYGSLMNSYGFGASGGITPAGGVGIAPGGITPAGRADGAPGGAAVPGAETPGKPGGKAPGCAPPGNVAPGESPGGVPPGGPAISFMRSTIVLGMDAETLIVEPVKFTCIELMTKSMSGTINFNNGCCFSCSICLVVSV